ncbi:MAG: hypothetical protein GY851_13585 [bacterium]|nr:hypothetical protein [bacterium]
MLYLSPWNLRVEGDVLTGRSLPGRKVTVQREDVTHVRFDVHVLGTVTTKGRFKVWCLSKHYPEVLRFLLDMPKDSCSFSGNLWLHEFHYRTYWWAVPRKRVSTVLSMLDEVRARLGREC